MRFLVGIGVRLAMQLAMNASQAPRRDKGRVVPAQNRSLRFAVVRPKPESRSEHERLDQRFRGWPQAGRE
jgi:hypothetical protein